MIGFRPASCNSSLEGTDETFIPITFQWLRGTRTAKRDETGKGYTGRRIMGNWACARMGAPVAVVGSTQRQRKQTS
jgi:hypothetical protein